MNSVFRPTSETSLQFHVKFALRKTKRSRFSASKHVRLSPAMSPVELKRRSSQGSPSNVERRHWEEETWPCCHSTSWVDLTLSVGMVQPSTWPAQFRPRQWEMGHWPAASADGVRARCPMTPRSPRPRLVSPFYAAGCRRSCHYFRLQCGRHAEEWRSSKLHWGRQISPWCVVRHLLCMSTWNVDRELLSQCTLLQSSEEWIAVSVQLQSRLQSSLDQCRTRRSAETKEWLALRCWAGTGSAV